MAYDRKLLTSEVVYDESLAKGVLKRELRRGNSRFDAVMDEFVKSSKTSSISKNFQRFIGAMKNALGDALIFESIEKSHTKILKTCLGLLTDKGAAGIVVFSIILFEKKTFRKWIRDDDDESSPFAGHIVGAVTHHFLERQVLKEQATTLRALASRTHPIFKIFIALKDASLKLPTDFMAVLFDGYAVFRYNEGVPLGVTWVPFSEQKKLSAICKSIGKDRAILIDEHTFNNTEYLDPLLIDQFKITPEASFLTIKFAGWVGQVMRK
jgi:hypothetical protein